MAKQDLSPNQMDALSPIMEGLPHGSGIDAKWDINMDNGVIDCRNSFHKMDQNGFYCGWIDFRFTLNPWNMTFKLTGIRERDNLSGYLWETLSSWLLDNKVAIARALSIPLIPANERKPIRAAMGAFRSSLVQSFGPYHSWPNWLREVSSKVSDIEEAIDNMGEPY